MVNIHLGTVVNIHCLQLRITLPTRNSEEYVLAVDYNLEVRLFIELSRAPEASPEPDFPPLNS